MRKVLIFIFSILITNAAGLLGAVFTTSAVNGWYQEIDKPFFTPPDFVFGPVWTVLYILMGISLYFVLTSDVKSGRTKLALFAFFIQLILNALWSIIFFGLQNPAAALIEIIILNMFIWLTIYHFGRVRKMAAYLLIPYAVWVAFATILNFAIWFLNK